MARDDGPRKIVEDLVSRVPPLDEQERRDQADILAWVRSGAPLFRTLPPMTPPQHLAVYFALFDEANRALMLVDHVKAGCWLLPGGHVDDGEDPRDTVVREAREELGIDVGFHERFGHRPFFLSVTQTRGQHSHTDVTFWFVLRGDRAQAMTPDPGEFRGTAWFGLDEPVDWAAAHFDPHMARFVDKLSAALVTSASAR
ncbi:NUDIX hydrolase [Paractinoplanes rishiriensis]|uniref:DNA mismatch repair protein MutT n=1 Tax=Paractinoplanes rishiriensis TaxID=1050105 RepID=A0A919N1D0_9ACTN|nr:NUDIX hydrolase [Actinoplanes rishiriensis]GIF01136.1 DNA mismatch repair protein MutT [Actinoplanes rishiriensis]